jgi:carbon-monoxide dehydrogenase medium subunit
VFDGGAASSWLAGGTDLLVGIRLGARDPARVIDLKQIPELTAIEIDDASVRIGAAASAFDVLHNSDVPSLFPGLAEALNLIGSTQITGRCSAGGNLCNASPAADSIPALIANGAQCRILGPEGERTLAVEDFVVGPNQNALASGELLVELILPRPMPGTSDAYLRLTPRTEMDIAVAGAGVSITVDASGACTAARVAIGAVAPTALLVEAAAQALVGSQLDQTAIDAAVAAVRAAATPISDKRGTAEYRTHVVGVLVSRAIASAQARITEARS